MNRKVYKHICITNIMIQMTPELAEICGIHAGDGYLRVRERNKGEVDISGHLEEKEYYDNHVIPLFNKVFGLDMKGRSFSRGSYGFVTYNKEVRDILIKLGFPKGKKSKTVTVPKKILESKDKILYSGFLRGLLDTDGHIGFRNRKSLHGYSKFKKEFNYYPTITISTISKKLMEDTCLMLKELGIKHFLYSYQPKDPRDSYKYVIIMNGKDRLEKWMDQIGSKNPVKLSRYLIWKKFGFCPTNLTLKQREDILKGELDIYSINGLVV